MRAAVSAEIVDGGPHDRFATSKVRPEEPLADCEFPYIMPATEVGLAPLFRRSQTLPRRNARSLRHHGDQRSEQQGLLEVAILSESTFVCEQCKPDSLPLEECRDLAAKWLADTPCGHRRDVCDMLSLQLLRDCV